MQGYAGLVNVYMLDYAIRDGYFPCNIADGKVSGEQLSSTSAKSRAPHPEKHTA